MPRHNAKKKLRLALLSLLQENALERIDVQDIAAKACVSRQTFYYNFANKKALIQWIIQDNKAAAVDKFKSEKNIRAYLETVFRLAEECAPLYRELEQQSCEGCDYAGAIAEGLWECAELMNVQDPKQTLYITGCTVSGCVSRWIRDPEGMPADTMAQLIIANLNENTAYALGIRP